MGWSDLITIAFVLLALWTFLPRHIRRTLRTGLGPTVIALADAVRKGAHIAGHIITVTAYRVLIGHDITSRPDQMEADTLPVVAPIVTTPTVAQQPIVTPNNEYSSGLSDSGRAAFETKAQTIAVLYDAGIITNVSKAICKAYACSVQAASKPDSTYQMALKAVNRYVPQKGPQFRPLSPEQEAVREALGANNAPSSIGS